MSDLIDELKKEHSALVAALDKVTSLGVGSTEGQDTLLSVKSALLAHLKKEEEQLYPVLYKAAETDANFKALAMLARDIEEMSKTAFKFFEKYSRGGSGIEFAKDSARLFAILSQRISREESSIFTKYDELMRKVF